MKTKWLLCALFLISASKNALADLPKDRCLVSQGSNEMQDFGTSGETQCLFFYKEQKDRVAVLDGKIIYPDKGTKFCSYLKEVSVGGFVSAEHTMLAIKESDCHKTCDTNKNITECFWGEKRLKHNHSEEYRTCTWESPMNGYLQSELTTKEICVQKAKSLFELSRPSESKSSVFVNWGEKDFSFSPQLTSSTAAKDQPSSCRKLYLFDPKGNIKEVFLKNNSNWVGLLYLSNEERKKLCHPDVSDTWSITFDGKTVREIKPTKSEDGFDLSTVDKKSLENMTKKYINKEGTTLRQFIVTDRKFTGDPDQWKPIKDGLEKEKLVLRPFFDFFLALDGMEIYHYDKETHTSRDVGHLARAPDAYFSIGKSYSDKEGNKLLLLTTDSKLLDKFWVNERAEIGSNTSTGWFYLPKGGQPKFVRFDGTVLDTGDYDDDGRSEIIFSSTGCDSHCWDELILYSYDFQRSAKASNPFFTP